MRPVFHEYSDELNIATRKVPCYDIREVLSEKIRALIQRSYTAPRDYYDIWYLSNHLPDLDWKSIVAAFREKMKYKGLEFRGTEQLLNPASEKAVKSAWTNSLGHQINKNNLPEFATVKTDLEALFKKIF